MSFAHPSQDLAKRVQEHEDAMTALGLDPGAKLALRAAASALAKAHTVEVLRTLAESRKAGSVDA